MYLDGDIKGINLNLICSAKAIENKSEWAIEEKVSDQGENPFTKKKRERNLSLAKETKKQMKNVERAQKDSKKDNKLDTDKKALNKTLNIGK